MGKFLDFIERGGHTHPRSVREVQRRSVFGSYMTSVFIDSIQGAESMVGLGGKGERGAR